MKLTLTSEEIKAAKQKIGEEIAVINAKMEEMKSAYEFAPSFDITRRSDLNGEIARLKVILQNKKKQLKDIQEWEPEIDEEEKAHIKPPILIDSAEPPPISEVQLREDVSHSAKFDQVIAPTPFPERTGYMPLLEELTKIVFSDVGKIFENTSILFIQHLLSDFLDSINSYHILGLSKENTYIVGIPYSTKQNTVDRLRDEGYENLWTPSEYPFDDIVIEAIQSAVKRVGKSGTQLLIIEDGGYAVPYIHHNGLTSSIKGAVEQTANGIWMDIDSIAGAQGGNYETKKNNLSKMLKIPLVNVAEANSKKLIESIYVGDAVVSNLKNLLQKIGKSLRGLNVLVVGYGSIGSEIAQKIRLEPVTSVSIYDTDSIKLAHAQARGFRTSGSLHALIEDADIIIGATGQENVIGRDEFNLMKNGAILASSTSKRREFNWPELSAFTSSMNQIESFGIKHTLRNGNIVYIVAGGYPINFYDTSESIPEREIQFVPALLLDAAVFIYAEHLSNGLFEYNDNNEINKKLKTRENKIMQYYRTYMGGT